MRLNERAYSLVKHLMENHPEEIILHSVTEFAEVIDCGIGLRGGLQLGLDLAEICLAGLAKVSLTSQYHPNFIPVSTDSENTLHPLPTQTNRDSHLSELQIEVRTDFPVKACLASQYAGWQLTSGKYFAMGSGPMRAAYAKEPIFSDIGGETEQPTVVIGILETGKLPPEDLIREMKAKLPASVEKLILLVAPAASIAGTIQVVARCLETALHQLHEKKFPLDTIVSGYGIAPLPPIAKSEIQAIGWTNDAILYGGRVHLWCSADDSLIQKIGPQIVAPSSKDYGKPFVELFKQVNYQFYQIDSALFAPAQVVIHSLSSAKTYSYGHVNLPLLHQSFGGSQ